MADKYYAIDPAGFVDIRENDRDLYCEVCDTESTQRVQEALDYIIKWTAVWTCPNCQTEHDDEGEEEYEPYEED